jgi:hypothetical protein
MICGTSRATSNDEHTRVHPLVCPAVKFAGNAQGLVMVTTQGEKATAAAAHRLTRCPVARQPGLDASESRTEGESNRLEPVEQATADFFRSSLADRLKDGVTRLRLIRNRHAPVYLSGG